MKKKMVLFSAISLAFVGALAFVLLKGFDFSKPLKGTPSTEYQITLNEGNAPALEANYGKEGEATVVTKGDYTLKMKYRLAKNEAGNHVTLAPHGFIYNDPDATTYKNRVTGLESILVTYTSTSNISIRTSIRNDGKEFGAPQTVVSGTPLVFEDKPYYFMLEAGDAAAQINSIALAYSCSENNGLYIQDIAGKYTGYGNDFYAYQLELEGSTVRVKSLNKAEPLDYTGTAEIVGSKLKCTFTYLTYEGHYTFNVDAEQRVLSYDSKDGIAASFPEISLYKVYKVEDFERYTAQGQGFGGNPGTQRGPESLYDMTGLRADWHADWYTTSSSYPVSYFGDSGWRGMGSADFLQYTSTKGHNGSKAGVFKGNSNSLRYIQMKAPEGLPNIIGKGAYLSFWAKSYSKADLSAVATTATSIKALAFYNQTVTKSNVGASTRTDLAFSIPANSDWARYIMPLDASKNYYSFGFLTTNSVTAYTVIDDVEIYTVDPYNPVDLNSVYLRGTAVGGWDVNEANKSSEPVDPNNQAEFLNVHLTVGDFKIANADYGKQWGWSHLSNACGAYANFEAGAGTDNNIHCKVEGDYNIYLTNNHLIYIESIAPVIDPNALYLRGTAASGWDCDNNYKLVESSDPNNRAEILNVHLGVGDFKIAKEDWSMTWGWDYDAHVTIAGGAAANFEAGASDNNIHCKVEFNYNFYLTYENYIYVEIVPAPYPEGSFKGGAIVNTGTPATFEMVIAFGNEDNGLIAVRLSNADAVATNVSYNKNTAEFTITTTGNYSTLTFGNITGRYDYINDRLVDVACDGGISTYVTNNGSIEAPKLTVWDCDGTTDELRQVFARRYGDPWSIDTGNTDRITSNTEQFVSGTSSVKRRGWSGGRVSIAFKDDFNPTKTVQNIHFWVYNPDSTKDVTLRMFYYQGTGYSSHGETGTVTAKAGQWTYCSMGFGMKTIYNFQIADFNKTGIYLSFDNIALF